MSKLAAKIGVCALVLGLQCGIGFSAMAADINAEQQPTTRQAWNMQQEEIQMLRRQEILRHEQAMLQKVNETVQDWQWRQWQEHEQHLKNLQDIQAYPLQLNYSPVNW